MKKLKISACLLTAVLFCLAAVSWAGEASFFDNGTNSIIRAYTGGAGPYTVNIGAYDADLALIAGATFTCGSGNPAEIASGANRPDISMAFDAAAGTAYVVYSGTQIAACGFSLPDNTPPAVSITAPSSGATVSGTVTLSASASDNIGIAGVQFKVNGSNAGAEDTTAPYTISWNSTAVENGSYAITAVARDAAGNTSTSAPVNVNVSNGGTCPDLRVIITAKSTAFANTKPFFISIRVVNDGPGNAGAFNVKGYWSPDAVPGNSGDTLLFTGSVSSLNAGQSLDMTFDNLSFSGYGIHTQYYAIVHVDADNRVAECREDNNTAFFTYWLSR